jgi:hypothetical protein
MGGFQSLRFQVLAERMLALDTLDVLDALLCTLPA